MVNSCLTWGSQSRSSVQDRFLILHLGKVKYEMLAKQSAILNVCCIDYTLWLFVIFFIWCWICPCRLRSKKTMWKMISFFLLLFLVKNKSVFFFFFFCIIVWQFIWNLVGLAMHQTLSTLQLNSVFNNDHSQCFVFKFVLGEITEDLNSMNLSHK